MSGYLIAKYVLIAVWVALAITASVLEILYIKKYSPEKPVYLIVSLALTLLSYAAVLIWSINFEFTLLYLSIFWYGALGYAAGSIIQKYRRTYGKDKLADIIYYANIPGIKFAQLIRIILEALYKFLSSLIKSEINSTNFQYKLDKDIDNYLRNNAIKYSPYSSAEYQNDLNSEYEEFLKVCGYDDTYTVKKTFENKYYDFIYK